MGKLNKRVGRKKQLEKRKAEQKQYLDGREEGPCFIEGCPLNGDFIEHCKFCDFTVQVCTAHRPLGQDHAVRHVFKKHPVKATAITTMGVLRGQKMY